MTDLRTRLADALAECFDQNNITVGTHHPAIVADVLLSLPDIAIVELPKPDEEHHRGLVFHAAPYRVVGVTQGADAGFVDVDNRHILYRNARELAAALLAAANTAEEEEEKP